MRNNIIYHNRNENKRLKLNKKETTTHNAPREQKSNLEKNGFSDNF